MYWVHYSPEMLILRKTAYFEKKECSPNWYWLSERYLHFHTTTMLLIVTTWNSTSISLSPQTMKSFRVNWTYHLIPFNSLAHWPSKSVIMNGKELGYRSVSPFRRSTFKAEHIPLHPRPHPWCHRSRSSDLAYIC